MKRQNMILAAAIGFAVSPLWADETETIGGYTWTFTTNDVESVITGVTPQPTGDLTIGSGVADIGLQAFDCCGELASVTIPDGVKDIGGEAGGGFYDIALEPRLLDWPDIAHAGLIELKYLKPGDPEPTPEALAAIKAEAIDQLDRYCADPALVAKCHLKRDASSLKARSADSQPAGYTAAAGGDLQPEGRFKAEGGTISLHRLVLVFKGGDCILHEEV